MLVAWDLGFQSLVLAACLVFPVIVLVIRHKWRLGMARKEEINWLLVLASEEAAKIEHEASFGYIPAPVSLNLHCALCFSPTTTRCARCKAVRYWYSDLRFFVGCFFEVNDLMFRLCKWRLMSCDCFPLLFLLLGGSFPFPFFFFWFDLFPLFLIWDFMGNPGNCVFDPCVYIF